MPKGPYAEHAFAQATAACERQGFKSFKSGMPGANCRGRLAETIAARHMSKKKKKPRGY